ncbi:hypothetical protein MHBO_000115 [Bonamia ostreae]|uniref:Succinate dehydrogenase cytochrome b556 subunit n=1 Tax=Bonamia ostreae TaxID=126728 RepID=A0ABV2AEE6_9EUKA
MHKHKSLLYSAQFALVAPFVSHFLSGVRHIFWDRFAMGLDNYWVGLTGRAIVFTVIVFTLAIIWSNREK